MAINKTIVLTWKGQDYPIQMTMRLIDRLEEDLNLMKMVERTTLGDVRFSHVSKLIAILLQSAGVQVTQDDVWSGMFGGDGEDTKAETKQTITLLWEIFGAIFPEPKKKLTSNRKSSSATLGKTSTN